MRALAALAGVLLVALSLASTAEPIAMMTAPRLAAGDTWTYHTNTSIGTGFFLDGRVMLTVVDHTTVTVEGTAYDAYRLTASGSGTAAGNLTSNIVSAPASGSWLLTAEETVESAGLKTIASVLDLEANGTVHTSPFPLPFHLRVQNTSTYRVSDDPWRFPLAVGATGVVRSQLNFTEDFGISVGLPIPPIHLAGLAWSNVTYALEAQVTVDTPAGRFDAFRIREDFPDGMHNRLFFAPTAGNYVRSEAYNGSGSEPIATSELVSYRYQALEPPRFIGLTTSDWTIVLVVVAASAVAFVVGRRWLRRPAPPPTGPPPEP